jgi:hypothetical protein
MQQQRVKNEFESDEQEQKRILRVEEANLSALQVELKTRRALRDDRLKQFSTPLKPMVVDLLDSMEGSQPPPFPVQDFDGDTLIHTTHTITEVKGAILVFLLS